MYLGVSLINELEIAADREPLSTDIELNNFPLGERELRYDYGKLAAQI